MLFLGSHDTASFITGEILTVDGGQSLTSNTYTDAFVKDVVARQSEK